MPAAGSFGSLARNALSGPGLAQVDAAVARTVRIGERFSCELRAAVYNATGRVNYRNPENMLPDAGFGYLAVPIVQAHATRAGRDGELSLRILF
jgi:hypothetical protein